MNAIGLIFFLFLYGLVVYKASIILYRNELQSYDVRNIFYAEGGMLINGKYYVPLNTVFRIEKQGENLYEDHVSQKLLEFILHENVIVYYCSSVYFIDVIHGIELKFK